jgi:hypothetical protein
MNENSPLLPNGKPVAENNSSHRRTSVIALAAADAILQNREGRRQTQVVQQESDSIPRPSLFNVPSLTSIESLDFFLGCTRNP